MRNLIQIAGFLLISLSTGFYIDLALAQAQTQTHNLPQNSEIYFPGRTSSNTNSVHNVVADLNRHKVQAFIGQPLQVDLPVQTNPFQIAVQNAGTFASTPSLGSGSRPVQSAPQLTNQGFVSGNRQPAFSTSPNIIHQYSTTSRPQQQQQQQQRPPSNTQVPRPPSSSISSMPNAQQGFFSPTYRPPQQSTIRTSPSSSTTVNPYVHFAYELFVRSNTGTRNLVLSPVLTQATLALLQYGATGVTRDHIGAVVQSPLGAITHLISSLKSIDAQQTLVEYVSTVFINNDVQVNRTFAAIAGEARSSVVPVNFREPSQSVQIINSWVSQATRGTIPGILDQNADTRTVDMLLANAIYFKANWKYAFKTSEQGQFYKAKASSKPVTFIKAKQYFSTGFIQTSAGGGQSGGAYWVEIPYAGEEFSMVILVPRFRDTLLSLISELSSSHVQTIINQLGELNRQLVDLKMPKFDIQTRTSLAPALRDMGLGRLFNANPSELVYINEGRSNGVAVDDCIHSATLAVDEQGTIAAAANAFSIIPLSISPPDPEVPFIVDQPFLALIVDKRHNYPLFIAKIFDP